MGTIDPVEGMARAIVLAEMPGLAEAMGRGVVYWRAAEALVGASGPIWAARYGQPVATRAAEILRRLNCATVLTPYGRDLFLREYPVEAIPSLTPPEANDNAPRRRRGLGAVWGWLYRRRPSSSA